MEQPPTEQASPISPRETVNDPDSMPPPTAEEKPRHWTSKGSEEVTLRIEESGVAAEPALTVHEMFTSAVQRFGEYTALRWKVGEQWLTLSYTQYYEDCRTAAKGFLKLGLERYHGVGILGFNSPEWVIADVAAILAGGFAAGIYATNSPEACRFVAEDCEANVLVVENREQLQKILQVQDQLPHLKAVVQYKGALGEGALIEKKPTLELYTWKDFMELGRCEPEDPLSHVIDRQKPNQCCTLIYTSGTTGQPKGVMLSHDNLTWSAFAQKCFVNLPDATDFQESMVSYLPLSHIAAQMIDIWNPMKIGAAVSFAQPDALKGSLVETLKEVRPSFFMGVPRVWEKMEERMKSAGAQASVVRRKVAAWAKRVGMRKGELGPEEAARRAPFNRFIAERIAKKLVFTKVRKGLGLDRCSKCYTGAAPITEGTQRFFLSLDIPVYDVFGMSELTGPHAICLPGAGFKLGSCGREMPGCRTKISEDKSELCFSGRHVFMGYLNAPAKTEEALDEDGWLRSGDQGVRDRDGFLFITGRIKELIITAGGENIPPVPVEDAVKAAVPLISNAMLVGDKRRFLCMLLTVKCEVNEETGTPEDELTPDAVELCRKLGSKSTRVSQIAGGRDHAVHAAIEKGVARVNEGATSNAHRVKNWLVLDRDFSIPGGELGPTMKLRRPVVMDMYKDQIENFYKSNEATSGTLDKPTPPSESSML